MLNQLKILNYHNELIKTLFEAKSAILASNIAAPIVLIYVLIDYININILFIYLMINIVTLVFRLSFASRGLKAIKRENKKKIKKYLKLYLSTLFINSILLGCTSLLAITHATTQEIFIVLALAFGMVAGAMSTTTTVFHASILFIVPYLFIILSGLFLFTNETLYYIAEFTIIIFMYITIPATFRIFSSLKNNIDKTIQLKEQQKQLIQAERIASMGEIIHNIAHQWRQPLSIISTASSGLVLQKENDMLSDENFIKYTTLIMENTQYLSSTIDEFRDFIEDKTIEKDIIIQESIISAINITKASLDNCNIKLIYNTACKKPILLKMYDGQLKHVLINIINNAKEAIEGNNISDGKIFITLKENNSSINITIEDNANGIPNEIIHKIFEPYFTTKHNSLGTGLGLSMSHKIVTKNLNGKLNVKNTVLGAKFIIQLNK